MEILTVNKNDAGQRLDKFISKTLKTLPPSLMYKYIREKKIKVNRKRTEPGAQLLEGDTVQLFLRPEFLQREAGSEFFMNLKPCFGVVYEDDNIIICDKPVGLLCHSDTEGEQNTLIEQIKAYLWKKGEYSPEKEQSFAPALANRLDRNTRGLVLAAKNAEALRALNEAVKSREINKYYLCLAKGGFENKEAVLHGWLKKNSDENIVEIFDKKPDREAREIITAYRVISFDGRNSLLEIDLITGRTHQIRAHLAHIGHPLLGDGKYADNRGDRKNGFSRQALAAYAVEFNIGEAGTLGYLKGKRFELEKSKIGFLGAE